MSRWPTQGSARLRRAARGGHGILGKRDEAFAWLERAYVQRDGGLVEIKVDPFLESLHGDPRFAALLAKMKLPPD